MKKLTAILVAMLALCLVFGIAVAENGDSGFDGVSYVFPTRTHGNSIEYADEEKSTKPTCTKNGIAYYQCADDPHFFHEQVLYALGHDWSKEYTVKAGDCTKGKETIWVYKCTRCGETKEVSKGLIHTWSSEQPENEGKWGKITVEPTCMSEGEAIDYCIKCGVTRDKVRVIDKVGHTYVPEIINVPMCTTDGTISDGSYKEVCKYCGQEKLDDDGNVIVNTKKYDPAERWFWCNILGDWDWTPHDFDGVITTKKPSCTSEGVGVRFCKRCGEKEDNVVIPRTKHQFVEKKTLLDCYTAQYEVVCSVCGVHPHEWDWDFDYTYDWWNDYAEEWDYISPWEGSYNAGIDPHRIISGAYWDDFTYKVVSHQFEKKVLATDLMDGKKEVAPTCEEAGYIIYKCDHFDEIDHTDDEEAYKKVETKPALGHDWGEWVERYKPGQGDNEYGYWVRTCKRCGATEERVTPYDPAVVCAEDAHDWVLSVEASYDPYCVTEGKTVYTCSKCGTAKTETIEALGHDFERIVTKAPTYYEIGAGYDICKRCGYSEAVEIPMLDASKIESFVLRCYNLILDRDASEAEVKEKADALANGQKNAVDTVLDFVKSEEFTAGEDFDLVEALYETMLDRESDAKGYDHWDSMLTDGLSETYVVNGFAGSKEFQAICDNYGIVAGSAENEARDKNRSVTAFVTRCYREALGRDGDPEGLNNWTSQLTSGTNTPQGVAYGFVFSPEFNAGERLANGEAKEVVTALYGLYLDREPDEGGLEYWINKLEEGMTLEELNNGFAASEEFNNIILTYNMYPVAK